MTHPADRMFAPNKRKAWKHASASQLQTFDRCPRRWYLSKILGVWELEGAWLKVGKDAHSRIENYLLNDTAPDPMISPGIVFLPRPRLPRLLVERRIAIRDPQWEVPIVAVIDLFRPNDTPPGVTDHKSVGNVKAPQKRGQPAHYTDQFPKGAETTAIERFDDIQATIYTVHLHAVKKGLPWVFEYTDSHGTHYRGHDLPTVSDAPQNGYSYRWLQFLSKPPYRARLIEVILTPLALTLGLARVHELMRAMAIAAKAEHETQVAANPSACDDYGGCSFRSRCAIYGAIPFGRPRKDKRTMSYPQPPMPTMQGEILQALATSQPVISPQIQAIMDQIKASAQGFKTAGHTLESATPQLTQWGQSQGLTYEAARDAVFMGYGIPVSAPQPAPVPMAPQAPQGAPMAPQGAPNPYQVQVNPATAPAIDPNPPDGADLDSDDTQEPIKGLAKNPKIPAWQGITFGGQQLGSIKAAEMTVLHTQLYVITCSQPIWKTAYDALSTRNGSSKRTDMKRDCALMLGIVEGKIGPGDASPVTAPNKPIANPPQQTLASPSATSTLQGAFNSGSEPVIVILITDPAKAVQFTFNAALAAKLHSQGCALIKV